ncbi:rpsU [Scenedesmus sp. PABB004]|nr:rpsU [Scenedesmus sp. PABB004]
MAALAQARALAGSKALSLAPAGTAAARAPSNGARVFMRRRDSYMVEVNVNDTETEDQAVRRYMRAVVQSGVINKLRARRTKETKIETYKRKLAERAQARKLKIEEPTWEEFYGENVEEAKPFDEFFSKPGDEEEELYLSGFTADLPLLDAGYYEGPMYDLSSYEAQQAAGVAGGYAPEQGGYINSAGGYINSAAGGDYAAPAQQ